MKTTLYLGTNPAHFPAVGHLVHYPVIKIVPRDAHLPELKQAYDRLKEYTHLIFTSKNAVETFYMHLKELGKEKTALEGKVIVAIGRVTERHLALHGVKADIAAEEETQEGVIEALQKQNLEEAFIFLPRSSLARDALTLFLQEQGVRFLACDLYDTLPQKLEPVPDLAHVDEIVFTSPSTVDAFLQIYGRLPQHKTLLALGPITEERLKAKV
ncbi:MAG: uroporphyrinogen-III synthase [Chlamydiales bacterium]